MDMSSSHCRYYMASCMHLWLPSMSSRAPSRCPTSTTFLVMYHVLFTTVSSLNACRGFRWSAGASQQTSLKVPLHRRSSPVISLPSCQCAQECFVDHMQPTGKSRSQTYPPEKARHARKRKQTCITRDSAQCRWGSHVCMSHLCINSCFLRHCMVSPVGFPGMGFIHEF